ncbi:selenide, water dikinase SelD [Orrella marina]|uniref:Selenide, water dikinase n=1 Tax=Orrella marina TaxID=2163011 RepID=A0A2R4XME1_9BURK|nr:selenide, water dikinase SelD [Orrella marina]AWB34970.1 selenide, water dikinase SelD [Orrella marina]
MNTSTEHDGSQPAKAAVSPTEPRLTSLAHGGGCGCKIAPGVLSELLAAMPAVQPYANLLVGTETADDAAVYKINDQQALIATTDFFMPIVDDPFDFGRIAATNALSDVYAMGGTPILALAIVGMPINVLSTRTIGEVLRGGQAVCQEAGIPVAGGHSIDSVEPIYGLVALGLAHPDQIRRNSNVRVGDRLVLTKPLGVGVFSAAFKKEQLDQQGYEAMIRSTTLLNRAGPQLASMDSVHAMTDVTGFGLLGHAHEMARAAGVSIRLHKDSVPLLDGVFELAQRGMVTGASGRNWNAYGSSVTGLPQGDLLWRSLLTDPQTSGGLLVSCSPDAVDEVLRLASQHGSTQAAVVGEVVAGAGIVDVV